MKATMTALALLLGLATLVPGGQAHAANTSWTTANGGGAQGGGAG
jgi:hypothetical protein